MKRILIAEENSGFETDENGNHVYRLCLILNRGKYNEIHIDISPAQGVTFEDRLDPGGSLQSSLTNGHTLSAGFALGLSGSYCGFTSLERIASSLMDVKKLRKKLKNSERFIYPHWVSISETLY